MVVGGRMRIQLADVLSLGLERVLGPSRAVSRTKPAACDFTQTTGGKCKLEIDCFLGLYASARRCLADKGVPTGLPQLPKQTLLVCVLSHALSTRQTATYRDGFGPCSHVHSTTVFCLLLYIFVLYSFRLLFTWAPFLSPPSTHRTYLLRLRITSAY